MEIYDDVFHPELINQIRIVQKACKTLGKQFGIISSTKFCNFFYETIDIIIDINDTTLLYEGLKNAQHQFETFFRLK